MTKNKMIRFAALAAVVAAVGFGGIMIAQSQGTAATATAEDVTIAETGSAEIGTLTVTLDAAGSLIPADEQTLVFNGATPVIEVLVAVGDSVTAGQVLARLDTTELELSIRTAELQVQQAQAQLDDLLTPPTELDISLAEAQVTLAQAQLYSASVSTTTEQDVEIARLEEEIARNQLWQQQINRDQQVEREETFGDGVNWVEQQQYDSSVAQAENSVSINQLEYADAQEPNLSQSSLASANESLRSAEVDLANLLAGATADEIRQAEIEVEQAQLSLQNAQQSLDDYTLVAPFNGIITAENLTVGTLPPATGAFSIIDTSYYTMDLDIAEADIVNVSEGQPVTVNVQAFPDAAVTGLISKLDVLPTQDGDLVTYTAEVRIDNAAGALLRPVMSATATVTLEQLQNVLIVPNRFITTDPTTGETTVMVETSAGVYEAAPVTIGGRSTENSQILSGLTDGQTIVIIERETEEAGGFSLVPPGGGGGGGFPGGPGGGGGGGFPGG